MEFNRAQLLSSAQTSSKGGRQENEITLKKDID